METETIILIAYSTYLILISLLTFVCYGVDKARAKSGGFRISEKALLTIAMIGGAFGGLIGMKRFRHKTKHWYFAAINILGVIIHTALLIYIAVFFKI